MPKIKNKRKIKKSKEKKFVGGNIRKGKVQEEPAVFETMPIVFSWTTVDFVKKPLTEFYFTVAAVGAMAMIAWGIYSRSFITVVTFIMVVVLVILVLNEEPRKLDVIISEKGIDLNGEHYGYNEFKSFKISHMDEMPVLFLRQRKTLALFRSIYIEDEPINDLESFLGIYLEKEEDAKEA